MTFAEKKHWVKLCQTLWKWFWNYYTAVKCAEFC